MPGWWTVFNDPALDYLVASAAEENLTLKTAGCRILEARAGTRSCRRQPVSPSSKR